MLEKNREKKLIGIHDTIKGFLDGTVSRHDAEEVYTAYTRDYMTIQQGNLTMGRTNHVKGLLYAHNVHNFSKLTALLQKNEESVSTVHYAGNKKILDAIHDIVKERVQRQKGSTLESMVIQRSDELEFRLFYTTIAAGTGFLYLVSVTSSHYFNEKLFGLLRCMVEDLFKTALLYQSPLCIDFLHNNSNKLRKYFTGSALLQPKISVIYIFPGIDRIFGHLGFNRIREVSDFIMNRILDAHKAETELLQFAITTYIAMIHNDQEEDKKKKKKVDFLFDGITIPYKTRTIELRGEISIYTYLDEVYSFQNQCIASSHLE